MVLLVTLAALGGAPAPLADADAKIFFGSAEELLDKERCGEDDRRVTLTCRDQKSYVYSNEMAHRRFRPYIEGLGGGYVGVGADQGLTFIAWSRAELGWMMDYDPVVVRINQIHRAFILAAETRETFRALWAPDNPRAITVLREAFPKGARRHLRTFHRYRQTIFEHLLARAQDGAEVPGHWLDEEESYHYIRQMFLARRIRIIKGDLLKPVTLRGIARVAEQLGVTIRVVYLSNAEEYWTYSKRFRQNLRRLPMDERSVIIRTRHDRRYDRLDGTYAYAVESGRHFQAALADRSIRLIDQLLGRAEVKDGLMLLDVPAP